MMLEEINEIVNAFLNYDEMSEGKVKDLLVIPLLIRCYLDAGKGWVDIYKDFSIAKEGQKEVDIKIKTSESSFTLIEVKGKEKEKGKIFDVNKGKSSKVYPGKITLEGKVSKPSLLLDNEAVVYNLDGDIWGQAYRYVLQIFLSENCNINDINLIMTNGNEWLFMSFNRAELKEIYDSLESSSIKICGEKKIQENHIEKYVFRVLNLDSNDILGRRKRIDLQESSENNRSNKLKCLFENLKSYLKLDEG